MKVQEHIGKRFNELNDQMSSLPCIDPQRDMVPTKTLPGTQWSTSAMSLIQAVFGKDSPHYEHFDQAYQKCAGYDDQVDPPKRHI